MRLTKLYLKLSHPQKEFTLEPKNLNLIYGKNESGKTAIVDLLIKAFIGSWKPRESEGEIRLELENEKKEALIKIEKKLTAGGGASKALDKKLSWLNTDIFKLLIIRAGDLTDQIIDDKGNTNVFADMLASSNEYERIKKDITDKYLGKKVLKYHKDDNIILKNLIPDESKKAFEYNILKEALEEKKELINRVGDKYIYFNLIKLAEEQKNLKEELQIQEEAAGYRLYEIDKLLKEKEEKLSELREEGSDNPELLIGKLRDKESELQTLSSSEDSYDEINKKIKELDGWISDYESIEIKDNNKLRILPVISLILAGVAYFIHPALIFLFLIIAALLLIIPKHNSSSYISGDIERIKEAYHDRYNDKLISRSTLIGRKDELKEKESQLRYRKENADQLRGEITEIEKNLKEVFKKHIPEEFTESSDWEELLKELKNKIKDLSKEIDRLKDERRDLGERELIKDPPEEEFRSTKESELKIRIQEVREEIRNIENENRLLEEEITRKLKVSGEKLSFMEKIGKLKAQIESEEEGLNKMKAAIFGLTLLNEVIEETEASQNENIIQNTEKILKKINITRFNKDYKEVIQNSDNEICIIDKHDNQITLNNMSSGMGEQLLFLMRLSLAEFMMGDKKGFFILDDAFQYSDYVRREELVRTAVELANSGWQIFYLTMDDHIRELFEEIAEESLNDELNNFLYEELD